LPAYPHVKEFIDGNSDDFDNLEVRYPNGQKPQLVTVSNDDSEETISITGWNTETIVDYLKEKLGA